MSQNGPPKVVVVGAGPSGLTASYALCANGIVPQILERSEQVGGLMRSYVRPPYVLDLGRKELYTRIPDIDALWQKLLGEDYRPYPHRVGSLYRGRILELSKEHKGILRAVPPFLLARGAGSLLQGRLTGLTRKPRSYEEHWHFNVGAVFARLFAQGYWEKFRGVRWADMPPPEAAPRGGSTGISERAIRNALRARRTAGRKAEDAWRHPRLGCGQLYDTLHAAICGNGGRIEFGTDVRRITQREDGLWQVDVARGGQCDGVTAEYVVSSLSLEALSSVLFRGETPLLRGTGVSDATAAPLIEKRHVLLVYLFIDAPPRFPHAWLEVNDPDLRCGRITNFKAFGGDMVPSGKTCLCVEFFTSEADTLAGEPDAEIVRLAMDECVEAGLIDPAKIEDTWITRLARTNAASSWRELQSRERAAVLEQLAPLKTFFHVNRPGSDWASFAGLLAGQAIASGCRADFDTRADPLKRLEG